MLKPFTMSLGLVFALSLTGASQAGGLFHNNTYPSAQGPVVSPQSVYPTAQSVECGPAVEKGCGGLGLFKKCLGGIEGFGSKCGAGLCSMGNKASGVGTCLKNKFHHETYYTYEWVLKKTKHKVKAAPACAQVSETVYPSGQYSPAPTPQGYAAPQGYGSPQAGYSAPSAYGSGQLTAAGSAPVAATAAVTPTVSDEAPPAPEVSPVASPTPPAPPVGPQSRLLFSTPSGN